MQDFKHLMRALVETYVELSPELAQAQREHYENLVEQGFSEEQAFELVKEMSMDASSS